MRFIDLLAKVDLTNPVLESVWYNLTTGAYRMAVRDAASFAQIPPSIYMLEKDLANIEENILPTLAYFDIDLDIERKDLNAIRIKGYVNSMKYYYERLEWYSDKDIFDYDIGETLESMLEKLPILEELTSPSYIIQLDEKEFSVEELNEYVISVKKKMRNRFKNLVYKNLMSVKLWPYEIYTIMERPEYLEGLVKMNYEQAKNAAKWADLDISEELDDALREAITELGRKGLILH